LFSTPLVCSELVRIRIVSKRSRPHHPYSRATSNPVKRESDSFVSRTFELLRVRRSNPVGPSLEDRKAFVQPPCQRVASDTENNAISTFGTPAIQQTASSCYLSQREVPHLFHLFERSTTLSLSTASAKSPTKVRQKYDKLQFDASPQKPDKTSVCLPTVKSPTNFRLSTCSIISTF